MTRPMLPRLGAACGIVFPIAMFLAVGDGSHFVPWRAVAATWALVLALPFLAYLYSLLRAAEGDGGWLSNVALVAGVSGVLLKLTSHAPELAIHRDGIGKGTELYKALDNSAGAATVMSLYPLAVCCAAVAVIALREHVLPRWLGIFAAVTAVALAVNAGFLYASFVPALLLFLLWTLVTSIVLLRRSRSAQARVAYST
jgi:drug/metabolite transporter (DMT)-like permease